MIRFYYIPTAFLLLFSTAHAVPWKVDASHSHLTFAGTQAGDAFHGTFKNFTPVIEFDPAHPEAGNIDVTVDITSATIENDKDKNAALPTNDWFAAKQFPSAEFHSTAIRKTSDNHFEAVGDLTLRGTTKPVTLKFALTDKGNGLFEARGNTELKRNDFGIGQGKEWASDQWIAFPVKVEFVVTARK